MRARQPSLITPWVHDAVGALKQLAERHVRLPAIFAFDAKLCRIDATQDSHAYPCTSHYPGRFD
jgi:hypothetical protein